MVNYNGARFLRRCLGSLKRQTYPADRFEVILVDNASPDDSLKMVREEFPWVRVIPNSRNVGFAEGNNIGIRAARGEYLAFLNNDAEASPQWLSALVRAAESDPRVAACTSKILLFHRRLPLRLAACSGQSHRRREILIRNAWAAVDSTPRPVEFLGGVRPALMDGALWPIENEAELGIPVLPGFDERVHVHLDLELRPPVGDLTIMLLCEEQLLGVQSLGDAGVAPLHVEVEIPGALLNRAIPVIQNAGSMLTPDGSGWDRGAVLGGGLSYYESDLGQYEHEEEVFAACGAACLWKRSALEDVGLFDETLFMYYEDIDLSWRARLRGWKIIYVPDAVVRHIHCGSAGEWSPMFTYLVKRNRIAVTFKNGSPWQLLLNVLGYLYAMGRTLVQGSMWWIRGFDGAFWPLLRAELRAGVWFVTHLPGLLKARWATQRKKLVSWREVEKIMKPIPRPGR